MSVQISEQTSFTESCALHVALKAAIKSRQYDRNAAVKRAAETLCRELESERSVYGKQVKMISLMERGSTIADLSRKLRCSRRTVFRYLNHLEEAGIPIKLENQQYRVDGSVAKMLRA